MFTPVDQLNYTYNQHGHKNNAPIATICNTIDTMIEEEVKKTFASKKSKHLERGIAFPTCISVNHVMGHYSPLVDESSTLEDGDVAKM